MTNPPVVLNGKQVGRLRASYILFKESFRFVWSDKEMLLVPIIASILQLFLIGVALIFVIIPSGIFTESEAETTYSAIQYAYLFIFYVISAFTIACSQAVITHIVYVRAHNGDATLWSGIKVAGKHSFSLLVWACITSTVGIVLRAITERSTLFVKIFTMFVGAAWSVLTYFVVVAIVVDNKSVFSAIGHSGNVFKRTWGETLASNISLGLTFLVFYMVLIFALIGFLFVFGAGPGAVLLSALLFFVVVLITILLNSVLNSVLRTLLYVYASEQIVPSNFNRELLEHMLVRKGNEQSVGGVGTV